MIITGATVLISSDIWDGAGIVPDIWFDESVVDDILSLAASMSDYYLKQMNFIGNLRRV